MAAVRAARGGVRASIGADRGAGVTGASDTVSLASRGAVLPTYARADVTIVRGEGCRVWDDEGRAYLDFGARDRRGRPRPPAPGRHRRPRTRSSTGSGTRRTSTGRSRCSGSPGCSPSGSAARRRSSATRARRRTRRRSRSPARRRAAPAVVALDGGFHGRTLGALSATGQPGKWEGFGPLVPGVCFARPNDVESLEAAVSPGGELAAIMLEPVLGEGGVRPARAGLRAGRRGDRARGRRPPLRSTRCRPGSAGPGRSSPTSSSAIEPDLVTLAKGLGNGLPIGALLVRDGVADAIGPGDHGSTFGGNPVACAAACAVVEAIDDALLEQRRRPRRRSWRAGLDGAARRASRCAAAACFSPRCSTGDAGRGRRRMPRARAARPHRRARTCSGSCRRSSSPRPRSTRRSRSSARCSR